MLAVNVEFVDAEMGMQICYAVQQMQLYNANQEKIVNQEKLYVQVC